MSDSPSPQHKASVGRRFAQHVVRMPGWHKKVLLVAVVLAIAGTLGQVVGYFNKAPVSVTSETNSIPSGSCAFDSGTNPAVQTTSEKSLPLWQRLSPSAKRIGVSLVIGFLLGWIFRAFLKTMAMLTILVVGLLALLSYFNVLNIDLSAARQHYDSVAHWLADQAMRLKDVIAAHIPSGVSGTLGAFIGARRH